MLLQRTAHGYILTEEGSAIVALAEGVLALKRRLAGDHVVAFGFSIRQRLFKLAVSLGGTESLSCHPACTTHSGVPPGTRNRIDVLDSTILLSTGIEHPDGIVADLANVLED